MARRRVHVPPIQAPRRSSRGIAGAAWERHVGSGGFGQPGSQRYIRQFPVDVQREIVAREQARAAQLERKRTQTGIVEAMLGDDTGLFTQNLRRQSSNPERPRAEAAGYDSASQTLRIRFRVGADTKFPNGAVYEYYNVPRSVWKNLQRSKSPGRFVDRVLDTYPYASVNESFEPTRFFQAPPQ